jgi:putative ABC transport system permease protein
VIRLLRFISVRHLLRAPFRTSLTVGGIAVGVAMMVSIAAVNRAVLEAFQSTVETVAGKADLSVASAGSGFPEEILDQVRAIPGVAKAAGTLSIVAPVVGQPGESLYIMAVDLTDDGTFRDYKSADSGPDVGDPLAFLNSDDAILLSEKFARDHRLKRDDHLSVETANGAKSLVVKGLLKDEGPVRAFGGAFGLMDLYSAQAGFSRDRRLDRVDVRVAPNNSVDDVKARISAALGGAYEVERPERRGASVAKMLRSFQMGLQLASGVALLVGIFLVYNTVSIAVLQRRREIGTLRALGAERGSIRGLFALEGVLLGTVGAAIGVPFGAALARGAVDRTVEVISELYVHVNASAASVKPLEVLGGFGLAILGAVLASLRPAGHAASVAPVEAMKREVSYSMESRLPKLPLLLSACLLALSAPLCLIPPPAENLPIGGYLSIFSLMLGCALLGPALVLATHALGGGAARALLRVPGRLASENFARSPGRSAIPVGALGMGVAMTLCIGAYVTTFKSSTEAWIDQSVPADLFVTASARFAGVRNTPMNPALGAEVDGIPGVESVDRVRIVNTDYDGLRIVVLSLNPDVYFRRSLPVFTEGRPEEALMKVKGGGVLISENLGRRRGLHAGGVFNLPTPTGVHPFPIAGVIIDYTSDQGFVAIDRSEYIRLFHDDLVDVFEVYAKPGADLEAIRRAVLERFGKRGFQLFVLTNNEFRTELRKLIDKAFQLTYAMEAVAVLLALLGVINTLLSAVLDRTREIGLLRAIGATRSQVIQTFCTEAGFIGVTGGLMGIAAGGLMGFVVVFIMGEQATGWSLPYIFPIAMSVQMLIASMAAAVLAGLYPARRAAHIDVVDALSYE